MSAGTFERTAESRGSAGLTQGGKPSMRAKLDRWAVPSLAALGLVDASYLAFLHWFGEPPPCGSYRGCADVNSSPYAEIFGVPVAALGALLYAGLLAVALVRLGAKGTVWLQATLLLYGMVLAAAVFMAYLTAVELFVLHAICYWCVALAAITLALLVLVVRDLWIIRPRPGGASSSRLAGTASR